MKVGEFISKVLNDPRTKQDADLVTSIGVLVSSCKDGINSLDDKVQQEVLDFIPKVLGMYETKQNPTMIIAIAGLVKLF